MAANNGIVKTTLKDRLKEKTDLYNKKDKADLYNAALHNDLENILGILNRNPKLIHSKYMYKDSYGNETKRGFLSIIFDLVNLNILQALRNAHPDNFKLATRADLHLLRLALDDNKPIELINILIQSGLGVNDDSLHAAIRYLAIFDGRRVEVVKMLIEAGADVNRREEKSGYTPLAVATLYKRIDIVKILIDLGAHDDENEVVDAKKSKEESLAEKIVDIENGKKEISSTMNKVTVSDNSAAFFPDRSDELVRNTLKLARLNPLDLSK